MKIQELKAGMIVTSGVGTTIKGNYGRLHFYIQETYKDTTNVRAYSFLVHNGRIIQMYASMHTNFTHIIEECHEVTGETKIKLQEQLMVIGI